MAAEDVTAWVKYPHGVMGDEFRTSTMVGAASAKTVYTPVIDFLRNSLGRERQVEINVRGTVSGTNVDIALYGAMTDGGTKFQLLDAVVADLTKAGSVFVLGKAVDLNAYPAPYYYLGLTFDADEKANTFSIAILNPHVSL